jgi:malonyl-CoA O-methyltransferase
MPMPSDPYKQAVALTFGEAADRYQDQAEVQRHCADRLWQWLDRSLGPDLADSLPPGPIVEIGCGTGFVSRGLVDRLASRPLLLSDLSEGMLASCARSLELNQRPGAAPRIQFQVLDAEAPGPWPIEAPALIIGGFVLQWFCDPIEGALALVDRLSPGGWLVLSFPSCHSFRQWRDQCAALDLPFTANPLPDPTALIGRLSERDRSCLFQQEFVAADYNRAQDFFTDLRDLGTGLATGAQLSPGQLRRLMRRWDGSCPGGIAIDYHAVFVAVQR